MKISNKKQKYYYKTKQKKSTKTRDLEQKKNQLDVENRNY